MSDPRRLMEEGATEFETALLRAGRRDALSEDGRRRVLSSLGMGGGVLVSTSAAATAVTGGALFKIGGIGLAALAVWGGMHLWQGHESALERGTGATQPVAAVTPPIVAPIADIAANEPASSMVPASPAPSGTTAPPPRRPRSVDPAVERAKDSLPKELSLLDRARRELAGGNPALSLRLLDEYERSFPGGRLGTEAAVLRIESLARAGDRSGVAAAGKAFLARHPNGPYATRVRSLMGEARPAVPESPEERR
jgi:hypothetical protein